MFWRCLSILTFINHLKTHSYKEAKFQCEDCEFVGNTRETMNVHIGRFHTDQFECGLCERNLGNSSSLDVHLNTCEIYRCRMCWEEKNTISELKDHLKNHNNPQHIVIEHFKMSRSSNSEVSITGYKGKFCWNNFENENHKMTENNSWW